MASQGNPDQLYTNQYYMGQPQEPPSTSFGDMYSDLLRIYQDQPQAPAAAPYPSSDVKSSQAIPSSYLSHSIPQIQSQITPRNPHIGSTHPGEPPNFQEPAGHNRISPSTIPGSSTVWLIPSSLGVDSTPLDSTAAGSDAACGPLRLEHKGAVASNHGYRSAEKGPDYQVKIEDKRPPGAYQVLAGVYIGGIPYGEIGWARENEKTLVLPGSNNGHLIARYLGKGNFTIPPKGHHYRRQPIPDLDVIWYLKVPKPNSSLSTQVSRVPTTTRDAQPTLTTSVPSTSLTDAASTDSLLGTSTTQSISPPTPNPFNTNRVVQCGSTMEHRRKPIKKRSKTGCLTCRQRRIKCDEAKPKCSKCSRSRRECAYEQGYHDKAAVGYVHHAGPPLPLHSFALWRR